MPGEPSSTISINQMLNPEAAIATLDVSTAAARRRDKKGYEPFFHISPKE
jgi:hypothetical protein